MACLSFGAFAAGDAHAAGDGDKVQGVLRDLATRNAGYHDFSSTVDMVLRDASGVEARRRFSLKVLERPSKDAGDQVLIVFDAPADVKGTALLSHTKVDQDDDQWVYLPASKRTKRIAGSNKSGAFAGSEFSYEDLSGNELRKYDWKLLGTVPCGELQCYSLEAKPKDASSAYSKRIVSVETGELRIFSTQFFDRAGAKVKTLTYDGYTKLAGKYWRAQTWTMTNHQTSKSTVLSFSKLAVQSGLSASEFASGKLGDGR
jgi:outer membrane lipoprotein-sorting protein